MRQKPTPLSTETVFTYDNFVASDSTLHCNYSGGGYNFVERFEIDGSWDTERMQEIARLIFLLAGISYYKAFASETIDLGQTPVRDGEKDFLAFYYVGGLGEYSYKNNISFDKLEIVGGVDAAPVPAAQTTEAVPLVPFGGGIDSIVTIELVKKTFSNPRLFVMSPEDTTFAPLEDAAKVTGCEVLRAKRFLDPQIKASKDNGFLNGHVPVTAIVSALALAVAEANGATAVLMSNEASASEPNLTFNGNDVNHQFSKSLGYENAFRKVLVNSLGATPDWFSYLRHRNELWIGSEFAQLTDYHPVFRSCNRAFHIDPDARATKWCGECDKCAFIDLILSPHMSAEALDSVFSGNEPLNNEKLKPVFESLVSTAPGFTKPFECVGDISECRQAIRLASERSDRDGNMLLKALMAELGPVPSANPAQLPHNISEPYATSHIVG